MDRELEKLRRKLEAHCEAETGEYLRAMRNELQLFRQRHKNVSYGK
jgi:hypothetical protein